MDHLHPTAKTSQYNSICSVQREKRLEENAYSQLKQQGKKHFRKSTVCGLLIQFLAIFFIIFVSS